MTNITRSVLCAALAAGALAGWFVLRGPPPAADAVRRPTAPPRSAALGAAPAAAPRAYAAQAPAAPAGLPPPAAQTNGTPRKRPWDSGFISRLGRPQEGDALRFELTSGIIASGTVRHADYRDGALVGVSGELAAPEAGRFFFQRQTLPGKAGDFAGVVEFPASQKAYRIEPTGADGASELVERRLDEVICLMMPRVDREAQAEPDTALIAPLDPQDTPDLVPAYNGGLISLQSTPGATGVLYIDYRGGYTPTWGGITYTKPNVSNAQIKDVWKRVCEDYMPFNINVTTDIRVYEAAPENSRQRVICTPTTTAAPGAGGVAYMSSWNWTGDTPCWSFYSTGKSAAEVIAHEAGHTLSLGHDGRTTPSEGYFLGHGGGAAGWAPIMGAGYYQPVSQWSKGEYAYANNAEDDLAKITANNNAVAYGADDTGDTLATARYLEVGTNLAASAEGVIERTADTDALRFTTSGGPVSLTALPVGDWANLALQATLADAAGAVIASNSPQATLYAAVSTNLEAGTYTFRVTGAGRNSALTNGFSAYASLGYYSVTGRVAGARLPTYLSVSESSPNGTVAGTVPPLSPTADPLVYTIVTGNVANAFSLNSDGTLAVANAAALNYETLSSKTQFPVQYELFVTISNTVTPALTETDRRVVIQIVNVNEPPVLTGFDATILGHTLTGTAIGTVTGSDPDAYTVLTFSITAGNGSGAFAVGSGSGTITVAADLNVATQTVYTLTVRASDNGIPTLTNDVPVRVTVVPNATLFRPGAISYAVYDNIGSGTYVTNLTQHPRFPTDPTWEIQQTLFEGLPDRADAYGATLRGYLIPPSSGTYTFWVASDDNSELWMSASTNPAAMTRIAYVNGWTSPRVWTQYASQKSADRTLTAGQAYYIEARLKEGSGGDHLAVAWKGPATAYQTNVVSGLYLAPSAMNFVPHASGFTNSVRRNLQAGAKVGRITVSDPNPGDSATLTITAGNGGGLFSVDPDGWIRVSNDTALLTASSPVTLSILATDDGTPPLTGTSAARISLSATNTVSVSAPQRELFNGIGGGTAMTDLTGNAKYPCRPDALASLTNFDGADDIADSYGSRIRGYVTPPASGDFTFFISSDDASQLKLSRTTNAASATVIASLSGWTNPEVYTQYLSQISALQTNLVAGQAYYIEALHKEGGGGDHVSVAWAGPGISGTNVIGGAYLAPLDINSDPQVTNRSLRISYTNTAGALIGNVGATDSPLDTLSFRIAAGNTSATFALDPDTGDLTLADTALTAGLTKTNFPLTVTVQDSGYGGLYPLHTASATVTVYVAGPYAIGFTNTIRRDLQAGAKVGRVTVSDTARGGSASYAITAGNGSGLFSVGPDGWVRASSASALLAAASPVTLTVRVTDAGTPPLSDNAAARVTLAATNAILPTAPQRELFNAIGTGKTVSDLTAAAKFPGLPDALTALTNFASPVNIGDAFGSRIRAYVTPPAGGDYRFFITSDDESQLKFSRSGGPTNAQTIAYVTGTTAQNVWAQKTSQVSPPQTGLVAGQPYYIEVLHKEGTGSDYVSVAWAGPGLTGTNVIGGAYLTPFDINCAPQVTNHTLRIRCSDGVGALVGRIAVTDSPLDTLSFKITAGNDAATFSLNPDTGELTLADTALTASLTKSTFSLTLAVQDSGYAGLYPARTATATATVSVVSPPALSTFSQQGGTLSLVWGSLPGVLYQLQSTTNLSPAAWSNLGAPAGGTGGPLTNAIPVGVEPNKFYRLLLLE